MKKRKISRLLLILLICIGNVYGLHSQEINSSQTKKLTGVVIGIDGISIPGVNVVIKNTQNGVVTDRDGNYSIMVPTKGMQVLVFSFIGFQKQEVKFKGQKVLNVVMREESKQLKDVVIVGYGQQKKATITGSLSTIVPKEIERVATPSLSNALGGIMPGLITRQSSGEPGYNSAELLIRGSGTWANRKPLILVDGIPRDLNIINSAEIESFTILKDASATAVYGVRGANGVILVNTKKGKMGKPKIMLRTEFANLQGMRFPQYINGYEFASLMNEAVAHGTGSTENLPWTEEELVKFKNGSDPYLYPNVNWTDEILKKNAFQTINNLSVRGGSELVRYYVNVGFTSQSGLFKEDPIYKYRTNSLSSRYNFRSNVDVNLAKNLTIELGLGGIIEDRTYPAYSAGLIFKRMKMISPINYPKLNPDGSIGGGVSYLSDNPWALSTQSGYAKQFRNTLQGTFGAKWDLSKLVIKGLSLSGKFSYDYYNFNEAFRRNKYEIKQYLGQDEETGEDKYNVVRPLGDMEYWVEQSSNRAYYYEAAINFNRNFGEHHISSMLLFNRRDWKALTAKTTILNLPYRREGLAGRVTYDYGNRYLAEFNFGYNGSENFPKGKRYGFFPSYSVGYVISNEKFWNINFINHLKIRGSYGLVGNDQIGGDRFLYLSTIDKNATGYPWGATQQWIAGFSESKIAVKNVSWEISRKSDIGIDIEMFKGKVSLQADFFKENRDNILLKRKVIPSIMGITGDTTPWANLGKVENKGFDGLLEIKNRTKSGFFYNVRANFTFARNVIIENDDPVYKWEYQERRGKRVHQPFGLVALGFFESQEEIDNSPVQKFMSVVRPGDIKFKDVNEDGVIDSYDQVAIGYGRDPEIMYGFGFTLGYKGLDLTLNFSGAAHTHTFLDTQGMYPFMMEYPNYNVMREYYDNRWIEGADNSNAKYPAVINGTNPNNYQTNTLYMRDASYLRLKVAELGYNFPESFSSRLKIEKIRLFINGTDLLTFDKLKVIDPESNYGTGGYPRQRVLNFGAQLNF